MLDNIHVDDDLDPPPIKWTGKQKSLSGFRIEINPKTTLGKRLSNLSVFLRNCSDAKGTVTAKRFCAGADIGYVEGVWTVRKSGVISFKGTSARHGTIEFVYGKLTIGHDLDRPGHQKVLSYRDSIHLFHKWINAMFPYLSHSPLSLNLKITIKD